MRRFTNFIINNNGDLEISLTEEGKDWIPEFLENRKSEDYHSLWWDLNEYHFCNGYFDMTGKIALWGGPAISDTIFDEETTEEEKQRARIWAFMNYALEDELSEVLKGNTVIFTLIEND